MSESLPQPGQDLDRSIYVMPTFVTFECADIDRTARWYVDGLGFFVVAQYPGRALHVILDNLNTHKPKCDRWLKRHPQVHLHFTPTYASWLNQVEVWFSILSRAALAGASFTSPAQVREAIDAFTEVHNGNAAPFEWTKSVVYQKIPKKHVTDLRN